MFFYELSDACSTAGINFLCFAGVKQAPSRAEMLATSTHKNYLPTNFSHAYSLTHTHLFINIIRTVVVTRAKWTNRL